MVLYPFGDLAEVVLNSAGVEQVARGMTVVESAVDIVSRALKHTNTIVKLLLYRVFLVARNIVLARVG